MRRENRILRYAFFLAAMAFFFLLNGCNRSVENTSRNTVTTIPARLQPLFKNTKKICFGRFLVQVPETAIVVYGPAEVATKIDFFADEASKIEDHIRLRLQEVEGERQFLSEKSILDLPLFGKTIDGQRSGQKIVFGSKDQVGYAIKSYIPINQDLFVQSTDGILPEENIIDEINEVAKNLELRRDAEIPSKPGMCIEGGFVPGIYEYERVTIGVRLKEFPDVHLSIDVHKNLEYLQDTANPILLHENARENAKAEGLEGVFSRAKVLREQMRNLSIWSGQEVGYRTPAYKRDASVHEFHFHSVGSVNDPFHPELDIRLDSGVSNNAQGGIAPSINDEEALALWDMLITTVRLRRPSDATPFSEVKPKTPLGTVSKSGEACPQTGFWECTDKRRVDGDRRRLLKEGEKIPPVVVTGHVSFLRTLIGDVHRVAQVEWTLTAYEPMPAVPGDLDATPGPDNPANDTHA
jgi:hypothetical protein